MFKKKRFMQNIVTFIEFEGRPCETPVKIANIHLNRFTIDEDAANELLGIRYIGNGELNVFLSMINFWPLKAIFDSVSHRNIWCLLFKKKLSDGRRLELEFADIVSNFKWYKKCF